MNCPNCGQPLPQNTVFCLYCGKSLNQPSSQNRNIQSQRQYSQPQQPSRYNQPQYTQYQQYQQTAGNQQTRQTSYYAQPQYAQAQQPPRYQQSQSYYGQPQQSGYGYQNAVQPKKKNIGLIVGISVGLVAVIAAAAVLLFVVFNGSPDKADVDTAAGNAGNGVLGGYQKQTVSGPAVGYAENNDQSNVSPATTDAFGALSYGVYENEWADLRFKKPDGWTVSQENYTSKDRVISKSFFFKSGSTKRITFVVHSLQGDRLENDTTAEILMSRTERTRTSGNVIQSDWTLATILGRQYCGIDMSLKNSETGETRFVSVYLRRTEQYIVEITIVAESSEEADQILQMISPY